MDDTDDATIVSRDRELSMLRGLLAAGRATDVVSLLTAWSARERVTHPESLVLLADAQLSLGATDAAISVAREAVRAAAAGPSGPAAGAALVFALSRRADAPSLEEASRTIEPLVAAVRGTHSAMAARVHHASGVLRLREGRLEDARLALLDALAAATAANDDARRGMVHDSLGIAHTRLGDGLRALSHYGESLKIKELLGDVGGRAITHGNRGRLLLAEGRADASLAEFDADVELSRRSGDTFGLVVALNGRGIALTELRRFDEADAALHAAKRLAESGGHAKQAALCVKDLAVLAERRGRGEEAAALAADAVLRFETMGNAEAQGFALTVLGRILFRSGAMEAAQTHLRRAVGLLRTTQRADLLADALLRLAETSADAAESRRLLDEAESLAREHFLRDVSRDVRNARMRLDTAAPVMSVQGSRNAVGFGRDRREFHLVERLGKGGQGEAWKAFDSGTGRMIVVKRVPVADKTDEDRARIGVALREFEAAMRLDHAGIVRVHEVERVGGELLIAMELLAGPNLRARLVQGVPDSETAWTWIRQLAAAVDALHTAGIVHRDLKPANLVFDAAGAPVIIDFGLALVVERGDAYAGHIVGTAGYAAPEQWTRASIDHRADLFAFGVVAIEILTGSCFLTTNSGVRSIADFFVLMQDANRLGALARAVRWPDAVEPAARDVLRRLVSFDANARPSSAAAALAECGRG